VSGCNFLRFVFWTSTISWPDDASPGGKDTNMEALLSEHPPYYFDIASHIDPPLDAGKHNRGVSLQAWIQFQCHSCCKHAWNNQHWSFQDFIAVIDHKLPSSVDSHCFGAVWCLCPYTGFSPLLVHNSGERGPDYISCLCTIVLIGHILYMTNTVKLHSHTDHCSINVDLVSLVLKMQQHVFPKRFYHSTTIHSVKTQQTTIWAS